MTDAGPQDGPAPAGSGPDRADWIALSDRHLPAAEVTSWAVLPGCGAVVTFTGTVRDHSEGRPGVTVLDYSAYEGEAVSRMTAVACEARRRWPGLGRVALHHRTGPLGVSEAAVIVAVSAPHRGEAFEAARFCIDTVKETVPIWKRETWAGGSGWGTCDHPLTDLAPADPAPVDRALDPADRTTPAGHVEQGL
jgi:molybdopterin synthase catalytic subunit